MGELVFNGFEISGTTANRPTNAEEGQFYFNETLGVWQVYTGSAWQSAYPAVKWPMAAFGSWELANDTANTNGGGIVGGGTGDVSLTQSNDAAAFDASESGGTWGRLNLTNSDGRAYASDYQPFPDTPAATDAVAFGNSIPFCELAFITPGTPASYDEATVLAWEYSTGAGTWSSLTLVTEQTDSDDQSGGRTFQRSGAISFIPPSDWAKVLVGSIATSYWIRAVIQSDKADNMTTVPVLDGMLHELVTPQDGFRCPHAGTITRLRVVDGATGTLHTGSDVKFILMNFTTGAHSGEFTWAQDQRHDTFAPNLVVAPANNLGILVTQEDSGNDDPTNVMLELQVTTA